MLEADPIPDFLSVASTTGRPFWRRGSLFQPEGAVFARTDFGDDDWAVILADPWLKWAPAEPPVDAEAAADAEAEAALEQAVLDAIASLPPEGFGQDGKPAMKALKAVVPAATAAIRDRVWAAAQSKPPGDGAT